MSLYFTHRTQHNESCTTIIIIYLLVYDWPLTLLIKMLYKNILILISFITFPTIAFETKYRSKYKTFNCSQERNNHFRCMCACACACVIVGFHVGFARFYFSCWLCQITTFKYSLILFVACNLIVIHEFVQNQIIWKLSGRNDFN